MYDTLRKKIQSKKYSVGIIGLGYVGLPLALKYINEGIKVYGIDHDKKKYKNTKKESHI